MMILHPADVDVVGLRAELTPDARARLDLVAMSCPIPIEEELDLVAALFRDRNPRPHSDHSGNGTLAQFIGREVRVTTKPGSTFKGLLVHVDDLDVGLRIGDVEPLFFVVRTDITRLEVWP